MDFPFYRKLAVLAPFGISSATGKRHHSGKCQGFEAKHRNPVRRS
jgi:hypothetical protein